MMREVIVEVWKRMLEPATLAAWVEHTGGLPLPCNFPIYSYDNPRIHTNPQMLERLGIIPNSFPLPSGPCNTFPLPPKSPDMHRIIERVHGRICTKFRKWLLDQSPKQSIQACVVALQRIFSETETASMYRKDIASYPEMLQQIVAKEGSWPERRYR